MLKTDSVTTRIPPEGFALRKCSSFFLNDSMSLCRNVDKRAPDSRAPSIRLAWDSLSISTVSSRSAMEVITPREVA